MGDIQLIIITGISGAGKSLALNILEDRGYYCVDNLPSKLVTQFVELCKSSSEVEKIAIGLDIRGGRFFDDLEQELESLNKRYSLKVIFLDADDEVVIQRYKESRRQHPLTDAKDTLLESVVFEKKRLVTIKEKADFVIDTSELTPKQLKEKLFRYLDLDRSGKVMDINLLSFGFKRGIPIDADLVFDIRFLPNPHYLPHLKNLRGNQKEVQEYIWKHELSEQYYQKLLDLLLLSIPHYEKEGKANLTIAIGCTGGHHRSVAFVERLYEDLSQLRYPLSINHRDINKQG
ncbi:MAG: RNase adapter RapZ [Clostridia bacterium]